MKRLISITALLLVFVFCTGKANAGNDMQQQDKSALQQDTLTYTVYGMDCPGCEGGLEKQVNKIPSVQTSDANWVNQELKVIVKPDSVLSEEELEKRIDKANFTLDNE